MTDKAVAVTKPKAKVVRHKNRVQSAIRLPAAWRIARRAMRTVRKEPRLFAGIVGIYAVLSLVFTHALTTADVAGLKENLSQAIGGNFAGLGSGLGTFVILLGSSGASGSDVSGLYQFLLGLVVSLALIWALRCVSADKTARIRDAYYAGMYPLVPFLLVLLVVGVQLLPMIIGSSLFSAVTVNDIAVSSIERIGWGLVFALTAGISFYGLTTSLIALYIVTLPGMTPVRALRSANEIVRGRRWQLLRKLLFLPTALLLSSAVIMVPIIVLLTPLSQYVFFIVGLGAVLFVHAYMYTLYRELLNE
jgi:hypothetical protein